MKFFMSASLLLGALVHISFVVVSTAFSPQLHQRFNTCIGADPGPPQNWAQSNAQPIPDAVHQPAAAEFTPESDNAQQEATLKANRWSAHAPDPNLPKDEFRNQLKENMKRDLEKRRAADPNRGNQPAKHYLDSL